MIKRFYLFVCLITITSLSLTNAYSQCTWQTELTDGFEYTTICPDLIPGATIHNTPQQFAVHTGAYSLYLNFTNCVGGVGTCPGDTAYKRHFTVCRNMDYRLSAWFTTSFGGTQCNIKMVVTDGNGNVLNSQPNIAPPYAPAWIQYTSGTVTPQTDDLYLILITNVGGGGGNDLSMDDMIFEKCSFTVTQGTSTTGNICDNLQEADLFDFLPANSVNTGSWNGPGTLTGGYLGTYTLASSTPGAYVYSSYFYGTGPGCPPASDTVTTAFIAAPTASLGNDTVLCTSQSMLLHANGGNPGDSYLWNTGLTSSSILVLYSVVSGDTVNYTVRITNPAGCADTDTIQVVFLNCSGIADQDAAISYSLSPNPAYDHLVIRSDAHAIDKIEILDGLGRLVKTNTDQGMYEIYVGDLKPAVYFVRISVENNFLVKKFIKY
jgi:hypothetical protein